MIKKILDKTLKNSAFESAVIAADKIVFSQQVVEACKKNYCGKYNTCWTCPPAVGKLEELEKKYKGYLNAYVFTTKHSIEDSFDIEGMDRARENHLAVEKKALQSLKGCNFEWLTAGSCGICKKCTYPHAPCAFPQKARPSVEACGIDVVTLAKTCNISYYNGENTVTFFSVIFFNKNEN